MKSGAEPFEKIFDALNNLYLKTDAILFEMETLAAEIRKKLDEEGSASALAEEALADGPKGSQEEKRKAAAEAAGELDIW